MRDIFVHSEKKTFIKFENMSINLGFTSLWQETLIKNYFSNIYVKRIFRQD